MTTPAILLMGPTASGKTEVAVHLAETLPCEIVSVDSALVYRGMDIGTAKPDASIRARAPHHLIDIADPAEPYSAGRFVADAGAVIEAIVARGRVPVLTGGTMLYFHALLRGLADLPAADVVLRAELERAAAERGWPALHRELAAVDPVTAARLHPNDAQRIQRALEVHRLSGRPLSEQTGGTPPPALDRPLLRFALAPAHRAELHARIARRFDQMLTAGFVEEVAALRARVDLGPELPSMRAVGYRQVWAYLDGACNQAEMVERGVAATRQLARRQLGWLRREEGVTWIDATDERLPGLVRERVAPMLSS